MFDDSYYQLNARQPTYCRLASGKIVEYDACGDRKDEYSSKEYICLGQGVIYRIGNVLQHDKQKMYFFTLK